ncbi:MAG: hypothetical protein HUU41_19910 [Bryobacteraceae bacterium]|nr:hypothetical protein [Bryobacterales bacterium]MEB2363745.1 hypothetical protein [Bryobacterales bacterium]NUN03378.1 hypothetical protein [Bryobacteraceae bacterium]
MFFRSAIVFGALLLSSGVFGQSKYSGPRPPKPDVPYLLHAENLVPTETAEAKEESRRNNTTYTVPGAASPARTPLAEPIFLFQSQSISPEKLQLYQLEVKDGNREIEFPENRNKAPRPYPLSITRLAQGLYRVEASATLENGQYVLTPTGSNIVFLFEVY